MSRMINSKGYTLVELILAMAIFNLVLMTLIAGVLWLFHIYQAGIGIRATQQSARFVMEEISRDSRSAARWTTGPNKVCLYDSATSPGGAVYYIDNGGGLHRARHNNQWTDSDCTPSTTDPDEQMTGDNVVTKELAAKRSSSDGRAVQVTLTVAAKSGIGDIEYTPGDPDYWRCKPGPTSQWCSLTRLETTVITRDEGTSG